MFHDYFGKRNKIPKVNGDFGLEIETEVKDINCYPSGFIIPEVRTLPSGLTKKCFQLPELPMWDGHHDGSLRNYGVEFVSKGAQTYLEVKKALDQFASKTKGVKFIENAVGTSVHVHCNVSNDTLLTIGNFLVMLVLFENLLVEFSGESRRSNLFALPSRCAEENVDSIYWMFKNLEKGQLGSIRFDESSHKYAAINLSSLSKLGTIEIRCFRGTTDTEQIWNWVSLLYRIVSFSRASGLTPLVIMDEINHRPREFFSEVFGPYANLLRDLPDFDHLLVSEDISRNLVFASKIAHSCDFTKLDQVVAKRVEEINNKIYHRKIIQYVETHGGDPEDFQIGSSGYVERKVPNEYEAMSFIYLPELDKIPKTKRPTVDIDIVTGFYQTLENHSPTLNIEDDHD